MDNEQQKSLTPYVNTEVKMSRKMMEALTLHEFFCLSKNIETVEEEAVKGFLRSRFNTDLANKFLPQYLIRSPCP